MPRTSPSRVSAIPRETTSSTGPRIRTTATMAPRILTRCTPWSLTTRRARSATSQNMACIRRGPRGLQSRSATSSTMQSTSLTIVTVHTSPPLGLSLQAAQTLSETAEELEQSIEPVDVSECAYITRGLGLDPLRRSGLADHAEPVAATARSGRGRTISSMIVGRPNASRKVP